MQLARKKRKINNLKIEYELKTDPVRINNNMLNLKFLIN